MKRFLVLVALAATASISIPGYAADQSGQACVGTSSASNGTWTYTAGTTRITNILGRPQVSLDATQCSFATSYPLDPIQQFFNSTGLANSKLMLQGSGDFSCANGGNGVLASPPLDEQQGSRSNFLDSNAYGGGGSGAYVVWTASFSAGVGQLTGTLHAAFDPAAEPQPVEGVIVVNCADPANGAVANTSSVLTMPTMPHSGQHPGPGIGLHGARGCVATAGYWCQFTARGGSFVSGIASATTGSWAITHQVGGVTVTDVSGSGPDAFPFPFADGVVYRLTVAADGVGAVAAGTPR